MSVRFRRGWVLLILAAALASCALPPFGDQQPDVVVAEPDPGTSSRGFFESLDDEPPRVHVSGLWVPALFVDADIDEDEPGMGLLFDADLDTGGGWGARAALGNDHVEGGLVFWTTHHDEKSRGGEVDVYGLHSEILIGPTLGDGSIRFRPRAGVGLGAVFFDFDRFFEDTGGASAQVRAQAEVLFGDHGFVRGGAAGFLWGYPGETIGTGVLVTVEGGIRF